MGEKLVASPRFLFVTNDYHVFRTSTYARRIGMKGDGLGCHTAAYYIPSAFIRIHCSMCEDEMAFYRFLCFVDFSSDFLLQRYFYGNQKSALHFAESWFFIDACCQRFASL